MVVVFLGTAVFAHWKDWCMEGIQEWPECDDITQKWVNGLYLAVITVTTCGFGDFSPADNDWLRSFGVFLMIVGIPVCVTALTTMTNILFGERQEQRRLRLVRGFDEEKFEQMYSFVEQLRTEHNIGNYANQGEGKISRFEYLCFMLIQNGVLQIHNLEDLMNNFEEIGEEGTGYITEHSACYPGEASSKALKVTPATGEEMVIQTPCVPVAPPDSSDFSSIAPAR
jgi:hypothetical protein